MGVNLGRREFENRMFRRILGSTRDEVTGKWRNLHNEKLHDQYSSPNIVRVIKSRRMRLAGHVARMGRREEWIEFWWGSLNKRDHWGDPGVDGRIILGWIFRKWDVGVWTGLGLLRIETGGGEL
jgi:PAS domain-containing protein